MTGVQSVWSVRLSRAAEVDFEEIITWTVEKFGDRQAFVYAEVLRAAFEALSMGPATLGAKERPELGRGLCTLHVAREGRRGRHLVLFRLSDDQGRGVVDVLRLLHDAMELRRHAISFE